MDKPAFITMLKVTDLHVGIGGKEILKGLDLSINPGEMQFALTLIKNMSLEKVYQTMNFRISP